MNNILHAFFLPWEKNIKDNACIKHVLTNVCKSAHALNMG